MGRVQDKHLTFYTVSSVPICLYFPFTVLVLFLFTINLFFPFLYSFFLSVYALLVTLVSTLKLSCPMYMNVCACFMCVGVYICVWLMCFLSMFTCGEFFSKAPQNLILPTGICHQVILSSHKLFCSIKKVHCL